MSPFRAEPEIELPIAIGGFVAFAVPRFLQNEFVVVSCGTSCDPDAVNSLDRWVIGHRSRAWSIASDAAMGLAMVLPFAVTGLDTLISDPADGLGGWAIDALVLLETMMFVAAVNNLLSFAVRRPRPLVYDPRTSDSERLRGSAAQAFPAGHVSIAVAMATATTRLLFKRHSGGAGSIAVGIGLHLIAATAAVGRLLSGNHFLTDVLGGIALGGAVGLLIPWLHERPRAGRASVAPSVSPVAGGMAVAVTGGF